MRGIPHLSSGAALGKGSSVMNNGSGLTQWLAVLEAQRDARVLIVAPGRTAGLAELEITELAEAVSRRTKRRGDASGGSGGEDGDGVEASIASYAHRCAASLKQLHAVTPGEEEVRRRLHTSDGSILWSRRVPPLTPDGPPPELPFLHVCRGGGANQAVVVAQDAAGWTVHVYTDMCM